MQRMRKLRAGIAPHDSADRFRDLGVDVFLGQGEFTGSDSIRVGEQTLKFSKAVIATGARASAPPIPGLETVDYLTNETVFNLTELPKRLAVVGAGPIGCELAQSFARFGSEVTLIEATHGVMPREDRDAAGIVEQSIRRDGVRLLCCGKQTTVSRTDSGIQIRLESHDQQYDVECDQLLVAAGRAPNVEGMNLEGVGVRFDARTGVEVDDKLRTTNKRIYAAGDVCSKYQFTHAADFMARIVIGNALFLPRGKVSKLVIPWCTYTSPEVAHVGISESEAEENGTPIDTYRQNFSEVDRAILDGETEGFVKIHTKKGKETILGATIVAPGAGDMISQVSQAMRNGIGLKGVSNTISPYPTQAEAIRKIGDQFNRTRLTPFVKSLFSPGVYLMKDSLARVIYVGKAVNLRSRVGSYFTQAAAIDRRTADLVTEIADIDFIETDSEVDALLLEARLIKDVQPKFNSELKDDKTFPYLEITTREDFPRVEFTRTPQEKGTKLYGPFTNAKKLRGTIAVLQKIFKFRTCTLDIDEADERWQWFRPCLLASINQCTAPCNLRISKDEYKRDIQRLRMFLDGKKDRLLKELDRDMRAASKELKFEKAARIRDQIKALDSLNLRGDLEEHAQPEVFYIDPKKGMAGLQKIFKLPELPRRIEGVDIAHLQGGETVASLVQFIDGLPFKHGYKRYKIRTVEGVDDFASIREVVSRRVRRLDMEGEPMPDILLIDGGKGQLSAAVAAMQAVGVDPPFTISLAKREEEVFLPGQSEPKRLSRHSFGLRLLQYVRDESHRFAQSYHHLLRRKSTFDR
eukprot:g8396.t1